MLKNISLSLYEKLGDNALLKGKYNPHITIGKSNVVGEIEKMKDEAFILTRKIFKARIDKVYSKIMNVDEDGNICLEKEIEFDLAK